MDLRVLSEVESLERKLAEQEVSMGRCKSALTESYRYIEEIAAVQNVDCLCCGGMVAKAKVVLASEKSVDRVVDQAQRECGVDFDSPS